MHKRFRLGPGLLCFIIVVIFNYEAWRRNEVRGFKVIILSYGGGQAFSWRGVNLSRHHGLASLAELPTYFSQSSMDS